MKKTKHAGDAIDSSNYPVLEGTPLHDLVKQIAQSVALRCTNTAHENAKKERSGAGFGRDEKGEKN